MSSLRYLIVVVVAVAFAFAGAVKLIPEVHPETYQQLKKDFAVKYTPLWNSYLNGQEIPGVGKLTPDLFRHFVGALEGNVFIQRIIFSVACALLLLSPFSAIVIFSDNSKCSRLP